MNLAQWDPLRELDEFSDRLTQLFRRSGPSRSAALTTGASGAESRETLAIPDWVPAVDITETPTEYQLKVELPEVKRDQVKVSVQNNLLRIEGERSMEKEEKNTRVHRVERLYGTFLRTFTIPQDVDGSNIAADFKDGMLCVHLPKTEQAQQQSREIQIA